MTEESRPADAAREAQEQLKLALAGNQSKFPLEPFGGRRATFQVPRVTLRSPNRDSDVRRSAGVGRCKANRTSD